VQLVGSTVSELARLEQRLTEAAAEGLAEPELAQLEWRVGVLRARAGELDQALAHLTSARRRLAPLRDARRLAGIDAALGQASAQKGELERAAAWGRELATLWAGAGRSASPRT
jgi:hypothetical protein